MGQSFFRLNSDGTFVEEQQSATLLTLVPHIATQTLTFTNNNGRGIRIAVNVTAYTTGGITPAVKQLDNLGNAYAITAAITKIAATGLFVYEIYPGAPVAAGGITLAVSRPVGRSGQIIFTVDDATPITYSVTVDYMA